MKTYTITPLEWIAFEDGLMGKYHDGHYYVEKFPAGFGWWWTDAHRTSKTRRCTSLEDGKAKAEADWQARLLPALEEVTAGDAYCYCGLKGKRGAFCKECSRAVV